MNDITDEEYFDREGLRFKHPENADILREASVWPEEGRKDDSAKTPYHLIAPEMLEGVGRVLDFGAKKYGARNWEKGMKWSRPFAALMRHMWAWWNPFEPSVDEETGMSHLWHAGCCLMFLIAYEQRNIGTNDKPAK